MSQLNLIPGKGFIKTQESSQLNLIPGVGFVKDTAAAVGGTVYTVDIVDGIEFDDI